MWLNAKNNEKNSRFNNLIKYGYIYEKFEIVFSHIHNLLPLLGNNIDVMKINAESVKVYEYRKEIKKLTKELNLGKESIAYHFTNIIYENTFNKKLNKLISYHDMAEHINDLISYNENEAYFIIEINRENNSLNIVTFNKQ